MILNNAKNVMSGDKQVERIYSGANLIWMNRNLPKEYQPVNALVSNGAQWIETGVLPSLHMRFATRILAPSATSDEYFCSCRIDTGNTRYYLLNINKVVGFVCTKDSWGPAFGIHPDNFLNAWHDISSHIAEDFVEIAVDGEKKKTVTRTNVISKQTLPLFGGKINDSSSARFFSLAGTKCAYAKFWDNDVIIRDFIPALDRDGRPCMYDYVTKSAYYNAGTGEFDYE